jgi:hypothetical protein
LSFPLSVWLKSFTSSKKADCRRTSTPDLKAALDDPDHVFKEVSFTGEIVDATRRVPRTEVPDMPDRIVAATGVYFGVPVISRDGRIRASNVQTIW